MDSRPQRALRYVVLIALSALFATPFLWMLATSLTPAEAFMSRDRPLIPDRLAWENYREALTVLPFHVFLKSTLLISVLSMIGQTLSAAMVAFAFARLRFPFRDALFVLVLATMMLPPQV